MCLIWGIPYLLIKVSVEEVTPEFIVLVAPRWARWCCCRWPCTATDRRAPRLLALGGGLHRDRAGDPVAAPGTRSSS